MTDPTKTIVPAPTGATEAKAPEIMPEQVPYNEMDKLDEKAILASYTGQSFRSMVYSLPFKDGKEKAPKKCGIPGCAYDGKHSHTHVTGVGIQGLNEIVRQMGGVVVEIVDCKLIKRKGKDVWWAKAVARDQFTLTERFGDAECPVYQYNSENRFAKVIAQSKAERNAMKKVVPQLILEKLTDLANTGKTTFDESDVQVMFRPFWTDRAKLKSAWFEKMADRALGQGVKNVTPAPQVGAGAPEASPEGETAQEVDEEPTGGFPGSSKQKYALVGMITKGTDLTKDQALEFISGHIHSREAVREFFDAFKDGNFADVTAWINKPKGDEDE